MTTVLLYALGVLFMAVGVGASIALHEMGHLLAAKRFGVKCTQYMVGFGPTIWSRRKGETEYGVKAVPLGGYVRMLGMFPPSDGRQVRADSTGRWNGLIEQARQDSQIDVGPEDSDRLFYQRSVPQRLVIMLGGPFMNLAIAVLLLAVAIVGFGVQEETRTLSSVSACVIPADVADEVAGQSDSQICASGKYAQAPAAKAGLRPGDEIVAFDGERIDSWGQLRERIRAAGGRTVPVAIEREGRRLDLTVTPVHERRPQLDSQDNVVLHNDGSPVLVDVGFLGVSPTSELVPQPITAVPGIVGDSLWRTAGVVLKIPEKMVGVAQAAFGDAERDRNGPVSVVGIGRFAGEVTTAEGDSAIPIGWADRFAVLLSLVASLNLALFVFNLVPLLPLDGGHAAGALWEGTRRQIARLLRRADPGPVDVARALPLAYGVASLLIGMSVLLIYADLVRPIRLGG
jgi:membrane-associated protease RseP (regulator of RpoE activity)